MFVTLAAHRAQPLQLVDDRDHRRPVDPLSACELDLRQRSVGVEHGERAEALGAEAEPPERLRGAHPVRLVRAAEQRPEMVEKRHGGGDATLR